MKDFFTYVFAIGFSILIATIPISIIGYIFSDDSFMEVMKTSIMLSAGIISFGFVGIMLIFFILAKINNR